MAIHARTHSDAPQIAEAILKEVAGPRKSASVKEALKRKKTPVLVVLQTLGGNNGGKPKATKTRVSK